MKLAFIGLGVMGGPMAGHLAKAGHSVTVFNRTRSKVQAWAAQYGGTVADTPAEAARGAAIVFSCVGKDEDVRAVTVGKNGAFAGMTKGAVFVDHTTASARVAVELVQGKRNAFSGEVARHCGRPVRLLVVATGAIDEQQVFGHGRGLAMHRGENTTL